MNHPLAELRGTVQAIVTNLAHRDQNLTSAFRQRDEQIAALCKQMNQCIDTISDRFEIYDMFILELVDQNLAKCLLSPSSKVREFAQNLYEQKQQGNKKRSV